VRDYVHVEEICHALCEAIEKPANQIECYGTNPLRGPIVYGNLNDCDFDIIGKS
jgi:nucleoside-diphosphate-sugar epimerase